MMICMSYEMNLFETYLAGMITIPDARKQLGVMFLFVVGDR